MPRYTVPKEKDESKPRLVRVEDPAEIAAILSDDSYLIGFQYAGSWFAYETGLRKYRGMDVEIIL